MGWAIAMAAGGVAILVKWPGRSRLWGIVLIIWSTITVLLQAWMSSNQWLSGEAIIDVSLRDVLPDTALQVSALALGAGVVAASFRWSRAARPSGHAAQCIARIALPGMLLVAGSFGAMIALTPPDQVAITPDAAKIVALNGFSISLFADNPIRHPTSIAAGPDGRLYVSDLHGTIWALTPSSDPAYAASVDEYVGGFDFPLGIAWRGSALYVASKGKVSIVRDTDGDGRGDQVEDIITGLPAQIYVEHQNNGIAFGPDGRLYFGVGATSDAAEEKYALASTILSANPDGSDLTVYARGLRNPYDLAFNAQGDLFATDNGPAGLDPAPDDELNYIVEGGHYGFPKEFGQPAVNSEYREPIVLFPPHASADGLTFYDGATFPAEYADNAFVALWIRGEIVRVELVKLGDRYMSRATLFASGFANPLDVAVGPDGGLYVLDFGASAVYRVAWAGP